jgi:hypothetical protein
MRQARSEPNIVRTRSRDSHATARATAIGGDAKIIPT